MVYYEFLKEVSKTPLTLSLFSVNVPVLSNAAVYISPAVFIFWCLSDIIPFFLTLSIEYWIPIDNATGNWGGILTVNRSSEQRSIS